MRNLAFVIWMIGYPFCDSILIILQKKWNLYNYTEGEIALSVVLNLVVWVVIGILVYERKEK